MKTKEELNALKAEVETMSRKLCELTEEELEQVTGGLGKTIYFPGQVWGTVSAGEILSKGELKELIKKNIDE